jgi:NAD(P)-dependent dehydrogenase (short-subunit alcohol dehydrogenase family)
MGDRLKGKKALITGGAQGLGATIGRMMAAEGALVTLTDRNEDGAREAAAALNAEHGREIAFAFGHDVTDSARWDEVVSAADAAMSGINVLVNNAGIAVMGSVESLSLDEWDRCMKVNSDSVFFGIKSALRVMRDHQPGSIINISSISGLVAGHNLAAYNASKAAVWLLSKSVALHCAKLRLDIRSNSVHPAFIKTPILNDLSPKGASEELYEKLAKQVPLGRLGEPSDVGYAAIYLASDESRFMTGSELKLDGGLSAS